MPTYEKDFAQNIRGVVDGYLATLKDELVKECEILAHNREQTLRDQNEMLRNELLRLRSQVGKEKVDIRTELEEILTVLDVDDYCKNPSSHFHSEVEGSISYGTDGFRSGPLKAHGDLKLFDELAAVAVVGGQQLGDDFFGAREVRPGQDHGLFRMAGYFTQQDSATTAVPSYILDPTGNLKLCWDVIGIPVLAWDLVTIPMLVFGIEKSRIMDVMDWTTLIYWSFDIPLCFFTGYWDCDGEIVMEFGKIVLHYLKTLFLLDSIIVGLDWLSVVLRAVSGKALGSLHNVALLRALRITRFARLLRLRRLKAKWHTIEDHIDSEWFLVCVTLISRVLSILALTHYIGCIFFWLGEQHIGGYGSWLDTPYRQFNSQTTLAHAPWGYQYFTSLHWAITQFTPGSMHVQPQNIPERIYTIWCLMFGMVVFSSFIASVTQARMQLSRMMSKFDKDVWILRKFCRQNNISLALSIRMKRYVDMVLIPKFQKMTQEDVVLLPKLSMHLREELQTELNSQIICVHPFFDHLRKNKAAIRKICISGITHMNIARGDVVFSVGQVARAMIFVTAGEITYIPNGQEYLAQEVKKSKWVCEAALWTTWVTQGQLQGSLESTACQLDAKKFQGTMSDNPIYANYARRYGQAFLDGLNQRWKDLGSIPSDLQDDVALDLPHDEMARTLSTG